LAPQGLGLPAWYVYYIHVRYVGKVPGLHLQKLVHLLHTHVQGFELADWVHQLRYKNDFLVDLCRHVHARSKVTRNAFAGFGMFTKYTYANVANVTAGFELAEWVH
jgi:hypothetical protein